jgi:hypothetical protein
MEIEKYRFKTKDQQDAKLFFHKFRNLKGNNADLTMAYFVAWGSMLGTDREQTEALVKVSMKIVAGDNMPGILQAIKDAVNRMKMSSAYVVKTDSPLLYGFALEAETRCSHHVGLAAFHAQDCLFSLSLAKQRAYSSWHLYARINSSAADSMLK